MSDHASAHRSETDSTLVPPFARRRLVKQALAPLGMLLLAGVVATGCGGTSGPAPGARPAPSPGAALVHATSSRPAPTTSTSTTLPQCGATRDPFDPTNSPPPPGSPAIC